MPAYRDKRTGCWRYRKWVTLPDGTRDRLTGTPATDTKKAAEHAEALHVLRVTSPGLVQTTVASAKVERKEVPTVKEFAARFMKEYLPRQKPSARDEKNAILDGKLLPFFGHLYLDELDQTHVNAFIAGQRSVAPKTLNNRLAVLSTLLRYAGPGGAKLIPECNLALFVKGMSSEIIAVPAADVAKLLVAATDDRYRVAVLLATEAGLRVGEIRGLQWGDLADGRLTVRRAVDQRNNVGSPKHDKRRVVRTSPALAAALDGVKRRGLWVVSTLDGGLLSYWAALEAVHGVYDRAGVTIPVSDTGVTMPWHSLRHTFGTEMAKRVPLPVLQRLMGHEKIETTMRYVQVNGAQMDDAIELVFGVSGQQVGNSLRKPVKLAEIVGDPIGT